MEAGIPPFVAVPERKRHIRSGRVIRIIFSGLLAVFIVALASFSGGKQSTKLEAAGPTSTSPSAKSVGASINAEGTAVRPMNDVRKPQGENKAAKPGKEKVRVSGTTKNSNVQKKQSNPKASAAKSASLAKMEMEVITLEKQIQRHMAAREKALVKVVATTPNCSTAAEGCYQQHTQVTWKASQDRYEKAALTDILSDKENSTAEGAALFNSYANKADAISGIHSLQALDSETSKLVHLHTIAEHQSLKALREAENKLHALKMDEQKARDNAQAAQEKAAISETQKHMMDELAKMSGHAASSASMVNKSVQSKVASLNCEEGCKQEATASNDEDSLPSESAEVISAFHIPKKTKTAEKSPTPVSVTAARSKRRPSKIFQTDQPYLRDFADAKQVEALRRKAFLEVEKTLQSQVLKERKQREKVITLERARDKKLAVLRNSEEAKTSEDSHLSSDVSEAYSSDFQQALKVEQKRQIAQDNLIELERKKSASEQNRANELKSSAAREAQQSNVLKPLVASVNSASKQTKDENSRATAMDISGDSTYRNDVLQAFKTSRQRESKQTSAILAARKQQAMLDLKAQARAIKEVHAHMIEAGTLATSNVIPIDYTQVSSKTYDTNVAVAKAHSLARTAKEEALRKEFYAARSKTLAKDEAGAKNLFANRESEVDSILGAANRESEVDSILGAVIVPKKK